MTVIVSLKTTDIWTTWPHFYWHVFVRVQPWMCHTAVKARFASKQMKNAYLGPYVQRLEPEGPLPQFLSNLRLWTYISRTNIEPSLQITSSKTLFVHLRGENAVLARGSGQTAVSAKLSTSLIERHHTPECSCQATCLGWRWRNPKYHRL